MPYKFSKSTKEEWLSKVTKDLKGKSLSSLDFTIAGQNYSPFFHPEDQSVAYPPIPGMPAGHRLVGALVDTGDGAEVANKVALDALGKGADLLLFLVPNLEDIGKKFKRTLLEGILTDIVTIVFAQRLFNGPTSPLLLQEGELYHFDGLQGDHATALFSAAETFREEGGTSFPTVHLNCTEDYFHTIAALRAFRLCWWRIADAFGKPGNCRILVHIGFPNGSDANHNKISAGTQAMSAVIGGADGLVVAPSDGEDTGPFSRRVAFNLQHVLEYESHLTGIGDAAAGTYFLEELTDHLAEKLWSDFQHLIKNPIL